MIKKFTAEDAEVRRGKNNKIKPLCDTLRTLR